MGGFVAVIVGLWVVSLVTVPSLAIAGTEDRSLGSPRFLPVQSLVMNLVTKAVECSGFTQSRKTTSPRWG